MTQTKAATTTPAVTDTTARTQSAFHPANLARKFRQTARTLDGFLQADPANHKPSSSFDRLRHETDMVRMTTPQF